MARYDDLHTGTIAYATFLSSIVLIVIILLIRALCFYWVESEETRKLADAHYFSSDEEISDQKAMLDGYKTVKIEIPAMGDAEARTEEKLHIPLSRAKELIIEEWSGETETEPNA